MTSYPTASVRTLALVGQAGSGKTTLAEALLAAAGAIPTVGTVEATGRVVAILNPTAGFHPDLPGRANVPTTPRLGVITPIST